MVHFTLRKGNQTPFSILGEDPVEKSLHVDTSTFQVNEAGLSRLIAHSETKPFAMISAHTSRNSPAENREKTGQLLSKLKGHKMGPILTRGHWTGEDGKQTTEDSFFVPKPHHLSDDEFEHHLTSHMHHFNQEAVLFGHPEKGVWLKKKDGSTEHIGKKLTLGNIGPSYSQVKGTKTPFVFEGAASPGNLLEAIRHSSYGLDWV